MRSGSCKAEVEGLLEEGSERALRAAHEKLCEEYEEEFGAFDLWKEWGDVLFTLYFHLFDEGCLEGALEKYECALEGTDEKEVQERAALYWSIGNVESALGRLEEGIEAYREAAELGCVDPVFRTRFGMVLVDWAKENGDVVYVQEGVELIEQALHDPTGEEVRTEGWELYAMAHKTIFELTGCLEDLREADRVFEKSVQGCVGERLWLAWGELFLSAAWRRKDVSAVEHALEKLANVNEKSCKREALLAEALALMGLFKDEYKWVGIASKKIEELVEDDVDALRGRGMVALVRGIFFEDVKELTRAVRLLKEVEGSDYALSQAWGAWGVIAQEPLMLRRAAALLEKVLERRPLVASLWDEWGVVLMQLYKLTGEGVTDALDKFRRAYELSEELEWIFHYGAALDHLGLEHADPDLLETSIELLEHVVEQAEPSKFLILRLATAYAHLGQLTANEERLYHGHELFAQALQGDEDESLAWCEWGKVLLYLSQVRGEPHLLADGEEKLAKSASLGCDEALYPLACLYSLSGAFDRSIDYLTRALEREVAPEWEQVLEEEWLGGVKKTAPFRALWARRGEEIGCGTG